MDRITGNISGTGVYTPRPTDRNLSNNIINSSPLSGNTIRGTLTSVENILPPILNTTQEISSVLVLRKDYYTKKKKIEKESEKKNNQNQERITRSKREKSFENSVKNIIKKNPIKVPNLGIGDSLFGFLANVTSGFLIYKLLEFLPYLMNVVNVATPAVNFLVSGGYAIGKGILSGLVNLVDFGYRAYDFTRGIVGNLFGEDGVENFDKVSSLLNTFLNGAIVVGLLAASTRPPKQKLNRPSVSGSGLASSAAQMRGQSATAGFRSPGRYRVPGQALAGGTFRSNLARQNLTRANMLSSKRVNPFGKLKLAANTLKPVVKNLPFIGGLMEFVLSWASGDPVGKAAFRGIGSGIGIWVGGLLGSLIPVPGVGTAIGMYLGGQGGASLGQFIYDSIFGGKKVKLDSRTEARSKGGEVSDDTPDIKKDYIRANIIDPQPYSFSKESNIDPEDLKKYNDVSSMKYFGPILTVAAKSFIDEKDNENIVSRDYENISSGLLLMFRDYNLLSEEKISELYTSDIIKNIFEEQFLRVYFDRRDSHDPLSEDSGDYDNSTSSIKPKKSTNWSKRRANRRSTNNKIEKTEDSTSSSENVTFSESNNLYEEIGVSSGDWDIYRKTLGIRESSGNYSIAGGSRNYYDGMYQMGGPAKTDGARIAQLKDPGHDNNPDNPKRVAFRENPDLQEKIFAGYTVANHTYLSYNQRYASAGPREKLSILAYAHLVGHLNASRWLDSGRETSDGNNVKGSEYYNMIKDSFPKMESGGIIFGDKVSNPVKGISQFASYEDGSAESMIVVIPGDMTTIVSPGGRKTVVPVPIGSSDSSDYEFLEFIG
tara:strand:- start:7475 stop:9952 length:2478 start_codon:yes stop_codon:yes gene_type:complete